MNSPASSSRSNRLYRSRRDSMLAGVCGGIAEHLDLSPVLVRVVWFVLCLTGVGSVLILVYLVLAIVLKREPEELSFNPARGAASYGGAEAPRPRYATRAEALREVQRRFERLEERLRRMESIVTDPSFNLEEEYRKL